MNARLSPGYVGDGRDRASKRRLSFDGGASDVAGELVWERIST